MKFSEKFLENAEILQEVLKKYREAVSEQREKLEKIFERIEESKRLHLYGKGRSSAAPSSLALRLKHFGLNVWYMGDYVKEPVESGDVVMLFSGSGETSEIVNIAKQARRSGAFVIAITSYPESSLAKNSDLALFLPGGMEKRKGWGYLEAQLSRREGIYGGGEFEVNAYLFQENLISAIGAYKGISGSAVARRHERDEVLE